MNEQFESSLYHIPSDYVLCGSSALEFMNFFSGYLTDPHIYVYSMNLNLEKSDGYFVISKLPWESHIDVNHGIKFTTFEQTINDMLSNEILEDPQALIEALAEYESNPMHKELFIKNENMKKYRYYLDLSHDYFDSGVTI